jgi:hypothetical protein
MIVETDIVDRTRDALKQIQGGPLVNFVPYTPMTVPIMEALAALGPKILATMYDA